MIFSDEAYIRRPTRAEVSISRLINNLEIVKSLVGGSVRIMAMVKSNAYGHGIRRVSEELLRHGVHYLGVAYLEEALFLRRSGIAAPILVVGAINTEQVRDFILHDVEITTSSIEKSRAISATALEMGMQAKVHIKVDTGMERIGVHWYHAERFIEETCAMPNITVRGIFSHLAKAESDDAFTAQQLSRFGDLIALMERRGIAPEHVHIANSAGIIAHPASHCTMVRPGIMLYGYDPRGLLPDVDFQGRRLLPAMTLKSRVSFFKVCPPETGISYNHTYVTDTQTRIVTLPMGYGDGYNRLLSNRGEVMIRGRRYPVAGSVCMDQTMVDIGPEGTAYNGDDVLVFGEMDGNVIPLESLCDKIGTITYEFLCTISYRVPRIYVP
ncbi:MAG: alanine racemase [Spirochaetes bacterium]|nr:alanine racemase [Spirochaetota bacterium]